MSRILACNISNIISNRRKLRSSAEYQPTTSAHPQSIHSFRTATNSGPLHPDPSLNSLANEGQYKKDKSAPTEQQPEGPLCPAPLRAGFWGSRRDSKHRETSAITGTNGASGGPQIESYLVYSPTTLRAKEIKPKDFKHTSMNSSSFSEKAQHV